jgi:methanethiol oxidase
MAAWRPDPTFYPSPRLAAQAPPERLAYVATMNPAAAYPTDGTGAAGARRPDALVVADVDPESPTYGRLVGRAEMPNTGDEFHHFGWNACSSALSPLTGHAFLRRRFLIIPGMRSSRIYVVDTDPHPTQAKLHKVIEPEEVFHKTGYSRPHTVHCGPEGIYISTLGARAVPTGRPASSSWTARPSRSSAAGRSIAGRSSSTMISGGTCRATTR